MCLLGIRRLITNYSTGYFGRTAEAHASLIIRAFAARLLKAGMKMQFIPNTRELYMHAFILKKETM